MRLDRNARQGRGSEDQGSAELLTFARPSRWRLLHALRRLHKLPRLPAGAHHYGAHGPKEGKHRRLHLSPSPPRLRPGLHLCGRLGSRERRGHGHRLLIAHE